MGVMAGLVAAARRTGAALGPAAVQLGTLCWAQEWPHSLEAVLGLPRGHAGLSEKMEGERWDPHLHISITKLAKSEGT